MLLIPTVVARSTRGGRAGPRATTPKHLRESPMPRPPGFDATVVLDRAMLLFWSQGYAGTSIDDLVAGTQLLRGSLYHAFGDKRSLYIHALKRYAQLAIQQTTALWDPTVPVSVPVLETVRATLMAIVDLPDTDKRRGSMLCNAIAEVVPHDPEIARLVEGILDDYKLLFQAVFSRAQHTGALSPQTNVAALARYLVSSIQGLCTTAKAGASREELLDIVNVTLSAVR
jgi:TetR/AcrR family transcriptional repressor of nem operon